MAETTITVAYTVTVKDEPDITAADKEAAIKQDILDQSAALASRYDWGISVVGSLTSDLTGTADINQVKPDYTE